MYEILSRTRIFKGLEPEKIRSLLEGIHYQVRTYNKEDIIAFAGDEQNHLLIVLEGLVSGEIINFEGKSIIVSEIPAPNSFAEAYLFASKNKLKINVKAKVDSKVLSIQKDYLKRLMSNEPQLLENYLNIISNRFIIVSDKLNFMMIKTVKGRLAYYFLNKQEETGPGKPFPLERTHQELAVFLGITRPALTRNLLEMKDEGIILIEKKKVTILDNKKMVALIS